MRAVTLFGLVVLLSCLTGTARAEPFTVEWHSSPSVATPLPEPPQPVVLAAMPRLGAIELHLDTSLERFAPSQALIAEAYLMSYTPPLVTMDEPEGPPPPSATAAPAPGPLLSPGMELTPAPGVTSDDIVLGLLLVPLSIAYTVETGELPDWLFDD